MKNSICAIGIYYGKFKNYFELWLKTCQHNPQIDFFIVTDNTCDSVLPPNVKIVTMPLYKIKERASKVTNLDVSLERPYKTCDYRPLFGVIFPEIVQGYEYWGEFDFDMLYGDIYSFLEKYHYTSYDKFLPLGHLSFYKNNSLVNNCYKLMGGKRGDYKRVLTDPGVFAFDEVDGINSILEYNQMRLYKERIFADITPIHKRLTLSIFSNMGATPSKNYSHQIFYWRKGKVYRSFLRGKSIHTEEFIYIHLRGRQDFCINDSLLDAEEFYITPNGFVLKSGEVTVNDIKTFNVGDGYFHELYEVGVDRFLAYKKAICGKLKKYGL